MYLFSLLLILESQSAQKYEVADESGQPPEYN